MHFCDRSSIEMASKVLNLMHRPARCRNHRCRFLIVAAAQSIDTLVRVSVNSNVSGAGDPGLGGLTVDEGCV